MAMLLMAMSGSAQTRYWVGGDGRWGDPANWSSSPGGAGGDGAPRENDDVVIGAGDVRRIAIDGALRCRSLTVEAGPAGLRLHGGPGSELAIAGPWRSRGDVALEGEWPVRLTVHRSGVELDLRGCRLGGDLVLDGNGSWSVISDMELAGDLRIRQGTWIANAARIKARSVMAEAPARGRIIAGRSVWSLQERPAGRLLQELLDSPATVVVDNMVVPALEGQDGPDQRDINVCGTGPGQTPFTVNSQVVTNYNGFGVRCRGNCNATVTVTVAGGSGNFAYSWLNGGPATATWTTACGGPQLVVVTDVTQGISCPVQINVTEPAPIGVIFFGQGTPPTCADVCNGSRTSLAIGGVTPATYSWNNGAGTGPSFSGLCPGPNTLRISDANNCTFDTTFTYNVLPVLAGLSFTNATCSGACDGTASVSPTGGTGSYVVTWTPPPPAQGAFTLTGLCAGNYSVRVADSNGCDTTATFTIAQPPPIAIDELITPATCPGTCDGRATVTASGTAGPYTFNWSPAPGGGQGTGNATGLCQGTYTVLVTDVSTGCDTLVSIGVTGPPAFDVQATVTDASCSNACDGAISLVTTGATPGYLFLWNPAPSFGQGSPSISGLCPGSYTVIIADIIGCDTVLTYNVGAPPPIQASITTVDVTCPGACDGEAALVVGGGTPGYTFLWDPAPPSGQGTTDVSGLCAGAYTVLIQDANGCDTTLGFNITEPLPITVVQSQTNVSCGTLCDGTASVVASGGTPGYDYLWTPAPTAGQATPDASGFCAGPVSLLITDASGCTLTVPFTIADAVPIQPVLQFTAASCPSACDGGATVTVTGGLAPYTYDWSPAPGTGQGTPTVTGLCAQAHSLVVTDATGCDTTITFTITAPAPIEPNATLTDATCSGDCTGSITLTPAGGNGSFAYAWAPAPPNGQGTPSLTGLCAGDWTVTITSGACDTTLTLTIAQPPPIAVDLATTNTSCTGNCDGTAVATTTGGVVPLIYEWFPEPGTGQGTGAAGGLCPGPSTLTITDASGCDTTLSFTIQAPPPIIPGLTTTTETCAGPCTGSATLSPVGGTGAIQVDWQPPPGGGQGTLVASGLCAGINYSVTLSDANGCDTTIAFTIQPSPAIVPNGSGTPVSCSGLCNGTATVAPTGGTAPYTYDWSPSPPAGQGTPTITGLCEGSVQVSITDAAGCTVVVDIAITGPPPILPDAVIVEPVCPAICDGSITLNTTGGIPPYAYAWSPVPPAGQGTNAVSGLCAGAWSVTITDATGCSLNTSFIINEPSPLTLDLSSVESQCLVCIGQVSAVIGGGTGPLTIEWTDGPGNIIGTTESVDGLCAGLYTATLTDANGCTLQSTISVTDSDGEDLTTTGVPTSCPNTCDGSVSVAFTCSAPPCTIAWSDDAGNGLGVDANTVTGLCPGDYYVTVTNGSGCISIDTTSVTAPVVLTLDISSTPVSCTAACDGAASVALLDGTPPYTLTWDPPPASGQGATAVSDLCAGAYELTVVDGNGCETTGQVLITEPQPLLVDDATVTDVSCTGSCDGGVALQIAGGTGAYTYLWTPDPGAGQGTATATGYCAGNVSVVVTDDNGCSIQRTFVIAEPQPLQVITTSTPSTCPNCDGTASAVVIGGTGPFTFSWLLGGVEISTDQAPTGLCGGVYTLNVTDQAGCAALSIVQVTDSNAELLEPVDGTASCANVCDGEVGVNFTCSAPSCTIQWTDAGGVVVAVDVEQVAGLCAGTYTVQVTNGNGCVSIADAVVIPATVIVADITTTPATCAGLCDGTATAVPSGGLAPYTYTWAPEPGGGQGSPQATGLCAGIYEVLVTDDGGCDTTIQVVVNEPDALDQQAIVEQVSCFGECDGSIGVTPAGGVGGFSFTWDPAPPNGQGGNGAFNLCAGVYELTLTDANGCTDVGGYTITQPDELVLSGGSTASTCGVCNGEAFVEAVGGTAPYTYLWTLDGAIYGTQDTLRTICAGLYDLQVTDDAGCTADLFVPVQDVDGELITSSGDTTSCPGACDGTAEVQYACGVPVCVVAWYDALGNDLGLSSDQVTDRCAGDLIVTVTNGSGCLSIDTVSVVDPDPISPNLVTTPVSCFGECDGTATLAPSGGTPPFAYLWDPLPGNGQGNPVAEGLCAGAAQVTVTDASGCSILVPVLITGPDELVADVAIQPVTCNGACDGGVIINPSGGIGPYTYNWTPEPSNGQGSNTITGLCAGSWSCQVTDANGCDTIIAITVDEPLQLDVQLATTDNTCFGDCIGTAVVTITGGTAPYGIEWLDDALQVIATDELDVDQLCAGDYTVRVTDANGCLLSIPFIVTEAPPIEAGLVFRGETCAGPCDGIASAVPTGGSGPYSFLWQPEPGSGQGTDQVTGLCAGDRTLRITDALGCDSTFSFTILPYTPISDGAVTSDVRCNRACDGSVVTTASGGIGPLAYAWDPVPVNGQGNTTATGLCPGTYTLTISDAAGCDSVFTYSITEPPLLSLTVDILTDASCADAADGAIATTAGGGIPPYGHAWNGPAGFFSTNEDIAALAPGEYELTLTDANNCAIDTIITVDALVSVLALAGPDQEACSGNTITLDGSSSMGAVTWSWRDGTGAEIGNTPVVTLTVPAPGDHVFTLVVTDGPCTSSDQVVITSLAVPFIDAGDDRTIFLGEATVLGGTPAGPTGAVYSWTPDSLLSSAVVPNPVADPTVTTLFILTVEDLNTCVAIDSVLVTVVPTIVIPTGFTPNADGRNDAWQIDHIDLFPDCRVEVYNRWGELLFQNVGYTQPWDGRYNDGPVPVGTYYYVIDLNDERFPDTYTGPLTIIR